MKFKYSVNSDKSRKERADRGQYAQGKVQDFLKSVARRNAVVDWERIYDARSSGGKIPKRPGDYAVFAPKHHIWIEVKQTAHNSRITKQSLTQIPKLTIRELAGGTIIILVYHSTTKLWRAPQFSIFRDCPAVPSWDLSDLPTFDTVEGAIRQAARDTDTSHIWRLQ